VTLLSGGINSTLTYRAQRFSFGGPSPVGVTKWKWATAEEFESASVRIDAHPRKTLQVRASLVRRPKPRAGCASKDRQDGDRQDAIVRDTTPRPPSIHPRPVSRNQQATTRRCPRPPIAGRPIQAPAEAPSRVLKWLESRLPIARIRALFQANPPEMSRKAVAREVPLSGYLSSERIETPRSGLREPLFRGA
jgi:hypothetical protein